LSNFGVPEAAIAAHLSVIWQSTGDGGGARLYGLVAERQPLDPITVPTLYIWGDADDTVGKDVRPGHHRDRARHGVSRAAAGDLPLAKTPEGTILASEPPGIRGMSA
jgi:pimeloyl-ACP methyl ester carboxylesterase